MVLWLFFRSSESAYNLRHAQKKLLWTRGFRELGRKLLFSRAYRDVRTHAAMEASLFQGGIFKYAPAFI